MAEVMRLGERILRYSLTSLEEGLLRRRRVRSDRPQVFIVGLPRSGTTLVYQYFVHRLEVAYFTDGVGRFPGSPILVTRIQRALHGSFRSDFRSEYGRSFGPSAPREAGRFWARFFGFDGYVRHSDLSCEQESMLQRTVWGTQRAFRDRVFVNKNVKHLLRIDALAEVFPASRFLVVSRNIRDVALSVMRARESLGALEWWSVKPGNYEALRGLSMPEQIAGQLWALHSRLQQDLGRLDGSRVVHVDYESFCRCPEEMIDRLRGAIPGLELQHGPISSFVCRASAPGTARERELIDLLGETGFPV